MRPHRPEHGPDVGVGGVVGVQHLHPQSGGAGDDRQGPDEAAGEERPGEQPALRGRGLALEEEAGTHPDHPDVGVPQFERVEPAFEVRLLPRVRRAGPAVGGPALVDPFVLRSRRVGADRRRVDEGGHAHLGDGLEHPDRSEHVVAPGDLGFVGGLEEPGEVDDGRRVAQQLVQVVVGDVGDDELGLAAAPVGGAAGDADHRSDCVLGAERRRDAGAHVSGRARDDHLQALCSGHGGGYPRPRRSIPAGREHFGRCRCCIG